ncbi:DUF4974 domain-containing protein [Pinibacter sp. MAH-24]|uniref:DUF4974 domain-containing protein n=2 Tax=Pinibacter soli TaxID=3044211 RepID=A0ABT6RE66_9BACT|nr:DUF4974 domain-containing protein [Pinibacter soli]
MIKDDQYYKALLTRYLDNECTPEELSEIMNYLSKEESDTLLQSVLRDNIAEGPLSSESIAEKASGRILNELMVTVEVAPVVPFYKRTKYYKVAAAMIAIVVSILYTIGFRQKEQTKIVAQTGYCNRFKNDVAPGSNKATLILGDGSAIDLDNANNGTLTKQGGVEVVKSGDKLSYKTSNSITDEIVYNTIVTPRGGQYQLQLPDGTKVWLNAATKLKFPAAFVGKERHVEIEGEAYFEVAQNISKPFTVGVHNGEVQVLGTNFNIMAYREEAAINTTLLQGSVKFRTATDSSMLRPGQQSQLCNDGKIKINKSADVDAVMAWKNGAINFCNADLKTVMRQLSRWYDVDIDYQNTSFNLHFVGELPRSLSLIEVLKALELTGNLHFGIEGKKIVVLPESK